MSAQGAHPLPFVKETKGPKGVRRTSFWAVKPSGNYDQDFRTGRDLALRFMAFEHDNLQSSPDNPTCIGSIVRDIISARDKSGIPAGFFSTLVGCSVAVWRPEAIVEFRRFYEGIDKDVDEQLAALSRRRAQRPLSRQEAVSG